MRANCFIQEMILDIVQLYSSEVLVIDYMGNVVGYANMSMDEVNEIVKTFLSEMKPEIPNLYVSKVKDEVTSELKYIVFLRSIQGGAVLAKILANQISKISGLIEENNSREAIYRKLILDEEIDLKLLVQYKNLISERARVVILVVSCKAITNVGFHTMKESFRIADEEAIFFISLNKVVIVKNVVSNESDKIIKLAQKYIANSRTKYTMIGIGKKVVHIEELKLSYHSAEVSLAGINLYDREQRVQCYDKLGIRRLISSLPYSSRLDFVRDIFKVESGDELDFERLKLLNSYIDEGFNMRKTAEINNVDRKMVRKLIDEYSKLLGADLSMFYTAVKFKIGYLIGCSLKDS